MNINGISFTNYEGKLRIFDKETKTMILTERTEIENLKKYSKKYKQLLDLYTKEIETQLFK